MGVRVAKVTVDISVGNYQILAELGEKFYPDLTMSQLLALELEDLAYRAVMVEG